MTALTLLALAVTPAADPASERIAAEIRAADIAARIRTANAEARTTDPPRDPSKEVVVTATATAWHAEYKGQTSTWPRSTSATDVRRLAGEFGAQVDAAREVRPTATFRQPTQPVQQPAVRSNGVTAGGANPVVTGAKSHHCPACGSGPWLSIRGWNPDGTHTHTCERCGTSFKH